MFERIKEYDQDKRLARKQSSFFSKHSDATAHYPLWEEVKFIDRDPYWYTRKVKEGIHISPYPDHINRDSGIKISEVWMPTIKEQIGRASCRERV